MKRLLGFLLIVALMFGAAVPAYAQEGVPPAVTAEAYLIMDADTGQILIRKAGSARKYPASITKIMTMALAMEKCGGDLSEQVTVSYRAVHALEKGSSHVALQPDEVVTLNDLFHATILESANDAANVLAEYTSGSIEAFVDLMNAKAAELGMTGTHYMNPHGLHDPEHYTTAEDMAVLTRWALSVPGFAEMFGETSYTMQPTNKQEKERPWGTDNCMLVRNKYEYEGTTGGKSGWTQEARYTMVETVSREGRNLISVVLHSDKKYDKFSDSIALLDYCFENFRPVTIPDSQIAVPQIPVYYSQTAPTVGNAPLALADGYTIELHNLLAPDDVEITFDTPEFYMTEQPFCAQMHFALRSGLAAGGCMNPEICTFSLGIDEAAVTNLLNANEKVFTDKRSFGQIVLKILEFLFGAVLLLAAVIAGRIAYVAYLRAQRKKKRMARRRAAALAAQQGLRRSVPQPAPVQQPEKTQENAPSFHGNARQPGMQDHTFTAPGTQRGRN